MKLRRCIRCKRDLPLEAFAVSNARANRGGLQDWCVACAVADEKAGGKRTKLERNAKVLKQLRRDLL